ncbi:MAG: TIGR04222 domain-containing membrane protein [Isosphaeraceae bacterium]|nr:TIGR04222 domain-containing membrane protein [Isosphaeraceae bacterium]
MNAKQARLAERIAEFPLDDPESELTFTQRLARENRWSQSYADRVVGEYRRFLILAMTADHPVSPSHQVDQAWHMHLLYTRSYWDELCGGVLGRPLHHAPSRGGAEEATKYKERYRQTLESYVRILGVDPPPDIWPSVADRFGRDLHFVRVNTTTHWLIPRPPMLIPSLDGRGSVLLFVIVVSMLLANFNIGLLGGFLLAMLGAAIFSILVNLCLGSGERGSADLESSKILCDLADSHPYDLIQLVDRSSRTAVEAAIARLVDEGRLTYDEEEGRLSIGPTLDGRSTHAVEQAILNAVRRVPSGQPHLASPFNIRETVVSDGIWKTAETRLRRVGCLRSHRDFWRDLLDPLRNPGALVMFLALVASLVSYRSESGDSLDRTSGLVVFWALIAFLVSTAYMANRPWLTPVGKEVVADLAWRPAVNYFDPPRPSDPRFLFRVAVFGSSILPEKGKANSIGRDSFDHGCEGCCC